MQRKVPGNIYNSESVLLCLGWKEVNRQVAAFRTLSDLLGRSENTLLIISVHFLPQVQNMSHRMATQIKQHPKI